MDQLLKLLGAVVGIATVALLFVDFGTGLAALKWSLVFGGVCQAAILFGIGDTLSSTRALQESLAPKKRRPTSEKSRGQQCQSCYFVSSPAATKCESCGEPLAA